MVYSLGLEIVDDLHGLRFIGNHEIEPAVKHIASLTAVAGWEIGALPRTRSCTGQSLAMLWRNYGDSGWQINATKNVEITVRVFRPRNTDNRD
jgi:hypothetical protein